MKSIVTIVFVSIFSNWTNAQQFSVPLSICDSVGTNQFHYVIDGYGVFTDSIEVHVELLNSNDNSVVFSGQHSMSNTLPSTLDDFTFDRSSGAYHFNLGVFTTADKILHMWLVANGVKEQEVYYSE